MAAFPGLRTSLTRRWVFVLFGASACSGDKATCAEDGVARITVEARNPKDLSVEFRVQSITATNCAGDSVSSEWSDEIVTPFVGEVTLQVAASWVNVETGWGTAAQSCTGTKTLGLSPHEESTVTVEMTDCSMQYEGM